MPKRNWRWVAAAGEGAAADVRQVERREATWRALSPALTLKDLRSLADEGKRQVGSGVVAIVGLAEDGKAGIVVGVTDDLTTRFNAVDLVRKGAEVLGGKGGGAGPTWRRPADRTDRKQKPRSKAMEDRARGLSCGLHLTRQNRDH